MTITVSERWEGASLSFSGEEGSITTAFIVDGTNDEFTAWTNLNNGTSATNNGYVKKTVRITDRLADETWQGEVTWGPIEPTEVGDSTYTFKTGGGTQKIMQSLNTASFTAGGTAPNFQGAIGVTDSSVEGVDIVVPTYDFSETHYLADSTVTASYKATLFSLTGKVNNATFKGFNAGEVLFMGASGSKKTSEMWEVSFEFSASPNVTGLSVGSITGISKDGWDYLWCRYQEKEDATAGMLVRQPIAVYVERVYERANLSGLGI